MAQRGRARDTRGERAAARRPEQIRRGRTGTGVRPSPAVRRARDAAKVLGLTNTRRVAVLAIVMCALAFTIVVPLRTYLAQRSDLAVQEQRRGALHSEVAALQARKAQLADPAQLEAEARSRLRFVMPGETPYIVQLPEQNAASHPPLAGRSAPEGAWYERMWKQATG